MDTRPKMYFSDLSEGMQIPSVTYGPMNRHHYIDVAILIRDNNPLHLDRLYAHERGFPDVIQQGPLSEAYLYRFLTDWLHRPWDLRKTKVRFVSNVFPNDLLTCKGTIRRVYYEKQEPLIDSYIWQENQKGEKTIIGEATFTVPEHP